jgi:hypothetical protein
MKELKVILIFSVLLIGTANAQTYNNGYLLERPAAVFRGLHLVDDTLVAHGYVAEAFAFNPVKYVLVKFDIDGNPLISYSAMLDSFTDYFTFGRFVVTKDSCFAFVGVKNTYNAGLLFKVTKSGEIVFAKEYADSTAWGYGFLGLVEMPDSGFAILANRSGTGEYPGTALIRTDKAGNTLWRKTFGEGNSPSGIALLNNENILLCTAFMYGLGNNFKTSTTFTTYMANGNLVDSWFDTSISTFGANSYLPLNDGGGIYVSEWMNSIQNSGGSPPTYVSMRCGYIVREDSLHNKIWELKLGQSSAIPNLFQIKKLIDGNYLAIGGTYDSTYTDGQPFKNTGWLIKFNESGNLIWQRRYFNTTDMPGQTNYLYDFVELADGGIVAAGERIDWFTDYPQQGWLLRLDSYGCLVPGCQTVGVKENEDVSHYLSLYPNPFTDQLQIYFNAPNEFGSYSFKLLSFEGRLLNSVSGLQNNTTYSLNTEVLPKGIFLVQLFSDDKLVSSHKIVKQ